MKVIYNPGGFCAGRHVQKYNTGHRGHRHRYTRGEKLAILGVLDKLMVEEGMNQARAGAVLKSVYSSVAEGELAALYTTAQAMVPLRNTLEEMGWKQPRSPIQVDNSTAEGYVNNTIITRRLKSLEMRLNWLKCRDSQGQFRIFWDKGSHNLADYHTKHHPPEYHIAHRHTHAG